MMGQDVVDFTFLLHFLARVVEEEVDQDGVELPLGIRVVPLDLAAQELDAPDAAAADLDLHVLARGELVTAGDARLQPWRIPQAAEGLQHLWDAVVGEHGQGGVDVGEGAVRVPVEAGPEVRHEDLGSLVQFDRLAVEGGRVAEVGERFDQEVDERGC